MIFYLPDGEAHLTSTKEGGAYKVQNRMGMLDPVAREKRFLHMTSGWPRGFLKVHQSGNMRVAIPKQFKADKDALLMVQLLPVQTPAVKAWIQRSVFQTLGCAV